MNKMGKIFLYQKVYEELLERIQNGTYPPGEKLPADDELCREFSVSAITVKKALEMLAESGCVKRVPGNGSFVRKQEKAGGEKGGKVICWDWYWSMYQHPSGWK